MPIATVPPPRVSAAVLRARPLAQAVRADAVGGALLGALAAMALAAPADVLVHVSIAMRLIATGAIAGGWVGAMFFAAETD
jgi:hypothetical protein